MPACSQIDNNGRMNAVTLRQFLNDPETMASLSDPNVVKSVTFKQALEGPNITKEEAMANSDSWTDKDLECAQYELPSASADFFGTGAAAPSATTAASPSKPATETTKTTPASKTAGKKRKARAAE